MLKFELINNNFTEIASNPVTFEFDIGFISFLTKLIEMVGMLKDPLGISCSISGNELSNFSANLCKKNHLKYLPYLLCLYLIHCPFQMCRRNFNFEIPKMSK